MRDRYCNVEILKYSSWQQASRILPGLLGPFGLLGPIGLLGPFGLLGHTNNTVVLQWKCFCYFNGLFFTQIEQKLRENLTSLKLRSNVRARRPLALLRSYAALKIHKPQKEGKPICATRAEPLWQQRHAQTSQNLVCNYTVEMSRKACLLWRFWY